MTLSLAPQLSEVASFGSFHLFSAERRLEKDGVQLEIGSRSLDILIVLVERAGENVSNRDLIARVWRDVVVEDSSLRVNIAGLRRVLGDGARYVANIPGQGYCFVAPVSRTRRSALPGGGEKHAGGTAYPLPNRLQRMVGRDEQVLALTAQVMAHRFVSIVGPGGMGKTTTAIAVAHALLPNFDGAVCFFDLGVLASSSLLASTMAATLGLMMTSSDPMLGLTTWLQDKEILLVLDNCEHLIETVATLAERLFHTAPRVFILATSREPLRAEGEHAHRLLPLESPPSTATLSAEQAMAFPAVQLFVDRAAVNGNYFELNDADAPVIAEICRKLDGIALAIELGAGRVAAFGVRGTADLLDNRFRLSWYGRRTALPRHQTLSAMLDWSYNLLPEFERIVLRRLSTFVGHFSLEAARQIAIDADTDGMQVVDAIDSLVAKSLASAETGHPTLRYRLLDSARVYAAEKLRASGEADSVARRHVEYLIAYSESRQADSSAFPMLDASSSRIDSLGNLRACLDWSFSPSGNDATGIRLCAAVAPLLLELSLLEECRRWSEKAIAMLGADSAGSRQEMALQEALAISSMFAIGNSNAVLSAIERGLELARRLGNLTYELRLLAGLNIFRTRIGDFSGALATAERSMTVARTLNNPAALAMAEWMLGVAYHLVGNQAGAQQHCEAGMALIAGARNLNTFCFGYDHRIRALVALARALWLKGNTDQAVTVAWQAIDDAEKLDHPISFCIALIYAAPIFTWNGEWDIAGELIEKLIVHAAKHMLGPYHAVGKGLKGELLVKRGEAEAGIELLCECMDALRSDHHQILNTVYIAALAQGLAAVGKFHEALATISGAASRSMEIFDAPEILRIQGDVLASMPQPDFAQAEENLRSSLDCARRQRALSWELRTATTLSRLLLRQGRQDEARRLLGDVVARFTEGFHTVDYTGAAHLLAELHTD
jgi:predicted ATPase/DNA-binding winged helix-turn-helix (wHTH) protein